jgi:hypothetical protein
MEKRLQEKLSTMIAFAAFCEEHEIIWADLEGFVHAYGKFTGILDLISTKQGQQEQCRKGVTKDKLTLKTKLADETVSISGALQAYSLQIKDATLYDKMDITFTQIRQGRDAEALSKSTLVYLTVTAISVEELLPYGIDNNVITRYKKLIDDYNADSPATRNVVVNKTLLTKELHSLTAKANCIMRKQLIKIARQFKKTNPDFYAGLILNAKVIRTMVHTKLRVELKDEYTNAAIANAKIEIEGTILNGFTDEAGSLTLTGVIEGLKTVIVTKANYERCVIENVHFKRGRSKTMHIKLKPEYVMEEVRELVEVNS